jgi:hypothetical protein
MASAAVKPSAAARTRAAARSVAARRVAARRAVVAGCIACLLAMKYLLGPGVTAQ